MIVSKFESFKNRNNNAYIDSVCESLKIKKYKINEDGSIDVDGSVMLFKKNISRLPIKFNIVKGSFVVNSCNLETLENSPHEVGGSFDVSGNKLKSLKYGPTIVHGDYSCSSNNLTNLVGAPKEVKNFNCSRNKLNSLEGSPIKTFNYNCSYNNLVSFKYSPRYIHGSFNVSFNRLNSFEYSPREVKDSLLATNNKFKDVINLPICKVGRLDNNEIYLLDGLEGRTFMMTLFNNPAFNIISIIIYDNIRSFNKSKSVEIVNGIGVIDINRFNKYLETIGKRPVTKVSGYVNKSEIESNAPVVPNFWDSIL